MRLTVFVAVSLCWLRWSAWGFSTTFRTEKVHSTRIIGTYDYDPWNSFTIIRHRPMGWWALCRSKRHPSALQSQSLPDNPTSNDAALGAWVPVASIACLDGLTPTKIEIMGREFVVWKREATESTDDVDDAKDFKTNSGQGWSVLFDVCPHRQAPLSLGRLANNGRCLECPYHGWQFDTNGKLQYIPQQQEQGQTYLDSTTHDIPSFPTHVTGDLLWTFLPTSMHGESFAQSLLPEDYYYQLDRFTQPRQEHNNQVPHFYVQELSFSFDFVLENILDGPAHACFAHHAVGFDRTEATALNISIPIANATHVMSQVPYVRQGQERLRRYGFQRPFLASNQVPNSDHGWDQQILFFAVPIRDGACRLLTTFDILRPPPKRWTPDWLLHIVNQKFFEGDLIIHYTEHAIRKMGNSRSPIPKYIYATKSDESVRAWRNWWNKYEWSSAMPHTFGPASSDNLPDKPMSRKELTNPWRVHTRQCSKCRSALRNAKLVRKASFVVLWMSLLLFRKSRIKICLTALLGAACYMAASRVITELEGPRVESEVRDRSLSASL